MIFNKKLVILHIVAYLLQFKSASEPLKFPEALLNGWEPMLWYKVESAFVCVCVLNFNLSVVEKMPQMLSIKHNLYRHFPGV